MPAFQIINIPAVAHKRSLQSIDGSMQVTDLLADLSHKEQISKDRVILSGDARDTLFF